MQRLETEPLNDSAVMSCQATDTEAPKASHEAVRFNAMKHGILSRPAVLAHEDAGEVADLLAALIEESRPVVIAEVLDPCRTDADGRKYYLRQAEEVPRPSADDRVVESRELALPVKH